MREFDKSIMNAVNEKYGNSNEFLEEFFPNMTVGELVVEMYNAGLIPDDIIEAILHDSNNYV